MDAIKIYTHVDTFFLIPRALIVSGTFFARRPSTQSNAMDMGMYRWIFAMQTCGTIWLGDVMSPSSCDVALCAWECSGTCTCILHMWTRCVFGKVEDRRKAAENESMHARQRPTAHRVLPRHGTRESPFLEKNPLWLSRIKLGSENRNPPPLDFVTVKIVSRSFCIWKCLACSGNCGMGYCCNPQIFTWGWLLVEKRNEKSGSGVGMCSAWISYQLWNVKKNTFYDSTWSASSFKKT